ncbi:MAG: hypothetical protein K0S53_175 [Bacteroidetes bacterium]|jgi:gliding motility-associated-like protein|nr:hypothetical protein [Bacteroidota bacterium]MDF2451546.1 hypothetical protein [Bacteroidota bacterium]
MFFKYINLKTILMSKSKWNKVAFIFLCLMASVSFLQKLGAQTIIPFTTVGTQTWVCPAGVTTLTVECWGAGGGSGGAGSVTNAAGGGGGGGAYASSVLAVTPGTTYSLSVGAGGVGGASTGGNGGAGAGTNFNVSVVVAAGGNGGVGATTTTGGAGGTGGVFASCVGTVRFAGGNGAAGVPTSSGGGGGSSAGKVAAGNAGAGSAGGAAPAGGVAGMSGNTTPGGAAGINGINDGGGAAGARRGSLATNYTGGTGGNGKVVLSYFCTPPSISPSFTNNICNGGSIGAIGLSVTGGVPFPGTPVTDQQQATGGCGTTYSNFWQSFTPGINGLFTSIDVRIYTNSPTVGNWFVYGGTGTGGPVLASGTYNFPVQGGVLWKNLVITGTPPLIAGQQYTFRMDNVDWSTSCATNLYPGGTDNFSTDRAFVTYMSPHPYNYSWSNSATTRDIFNLTAGSYNVAVTDAVGCMANANVTINQPPAITATSSQTNIICNGNNTGKIDLTVSGGTPIPPTPAVNQQQMTGGCGTTYSDFWQSFTPSVNGFFTSIDVRIYTNSATSGNWFVYSGTGTGGSVLASGTYNFPVQGGVLWKNVAITGTPPLLAGQQYTFRMNNVDWSTSCATNLYPGGTDNYSTDRAFATYMAPFPYNYLWSNGAVTEDIGNLTAGTYSVTVTDGNNCTTSLTTTITQPAALTANAALTTSINCNGGTGVITVSAAGGTPAYSGTGTFTVTAGTYSYSVTDANGCVKTTSLTVTQPAPLTINANASSSICSGGSTTLSASGAASYTWNPGGIVGASVGVTPVSTTIYTATGTSSLGCVATNTTGVTVNPNPTVTVSSSTICIGATTTLTASSATTYSWSTGATTSSISVSPGSTTNYTVTGTNGFACTDTKTTSVTVNMLPSITTSASPSSICVGANSNLTATGATTYTWNPGTLTGSAVTVSPASTTIYTVTGTNSNGCVNTQTINLTVNPLPALTLAASPATICVGATSTLTGTGATSYTWSPGGFLGSVIIDAPSVSTQYTVTGMNGFGCVNTQTVSLTVNPSPALTLAASPATMCVGATSTLTGTGATSYTWSPGGFLGSVIIDAPSVSTQYTVTGMNGFGCVNTQTVNLTVNPLPALTVAASPATICVSATATLTGTGATTYTWNPGSLTGSVTVVSPGSTTIYTVTGTNSNGCVNTQTVNLTVNPLPTLTVVASPAAICVGATSTLTGTGATTYTWNPGGLTGAVVSVSPASTTIYTLTGTNANGCVNTKTVNLTVNSLPTLTLTASPATMCIGATSTLTGTGATSYTWNPGGFLGSVIIDAPSSSTQYTVTGINGFGCVNTKTVNLTVNPLPTLTLTASPTAICVGSTATLTGTGATTYTWNPGVLTGSVTVVSPGSSTIYTVTGTNNNGCVNTQTVNLTVNSLPTLTVAASPTAICVGATSTLTGTGATTYTWNPGALTGSVTIVSPGSTTIYTVTGTNVNGCVNTQTVNLTVNPLPTLTVAASPATICVGATATLTSSGATIYTWNPGALTGSATVVSPGSTTIYTVTGTNANNCVNTKTLNLIVNSLPVITVAASPSAICVGSTATLTGTGATTYTWNPGALTGAGVSVSPSSTTIYTVTGTNANACVNTQTINLIVNSLPVLTAASSPTAICVGSTATITGTGATTYTWNPGALTGSVTVVSPASTTIYTLTGANGSGCVQTETLSLAVNALPVVTAAVTSSAICVGETATLTAGGAITYLWDSGASTSVITVTPTVLTVYTVTGTDANNCVNSETVSLIVNALPVVTAMSSPTAMCAGATATLTGAGATSYTWEPGSLTGTSVFVNPVSTTDYTITGIDGNSCMNTQTISLTVNSLPIVTAASSSSAICAGFTATLTAGGANSYLWDTGGSTAVIAVSPTSSAIYTVTGTDGNGCVNTDTVSLTVNTLPVVTAGASPTAICAGETTTLTATGASSYLWDTGAIGNIISVSPGSSIIYTVTGTDVNSCVNSETVSVTVNALPVITAMSSPTVICAGATATITGSGATSYTWNPGGITGPVISVSPISSTIYTVTGTNGSGCVQTETISLAVNALPAVTANSTASVICNGQPVTLNGSGALSYAWDNGVVDGVAFIPGASGSYVVIGTDVNGCVAGDTVFIIVNSLPVVTAGSTSTAVCSGDFASLTGAGALTYTWNPGALTGTTVSVNPSSNTVYTLSGTDGAGCVNTETISLTVNPLPVVTATASPVSICAGQISTLTAGGAVSYTWNPGALTGAAIAVSPSSTIVYTVTGADGSGCANTGSVSLSVSMNPTVTVVSSPSVICEGQTATLTASGAITYSWSTGANTFSTSVSPTSTSVYTVTGTNGTCTQTETISLTVNVNPTVTIAASPSAICVGQTSTLTAGGANTYVWSTSAATSAITVSPASTTMYTVTGTNSNNCTHTETVSLTVNALPTISVSPSGTTTCQGQPQLLQASGATSYTWSGAGSTTNFITVTPTVATVYTVTGMDANSCVNTATAVVNTVSQPVVSINSPSTNVCMGYTMTVVASGASNYVWSNGAITSSITVQPFSNITYSVIGSNNGACPDTAFLPLNVLPLPSVSASANNTLICAGTTVSLTAVGTAANFMWEPGGLFGANQIVQMNSPTTFTVVGFGSNGCAFFSTTFVDVPSPSVITTAVTPTAICAGDSAILSVSGATVSLWNGNAIPNTSVVMPFSNTTYTFSAVDVNGCSSDISFTVLMRSDCDEVVVYNGFTPNGDGINDVWLIDNIEKFPNNKVFIYNRWGNAIFHTTNYNNADNSWDGKLNGQAIDAGTYFYIIVDESEKLIKKGWLEITN